MGRQLTQPLEWAGRVRAGGDGGREKVLVLLFDLGRQGRKCCRWLFFYGVTTNKFIFLPEVTAFEIAELLSTLNCTSSRKAPKLGIPESLLSLLSISFIDFDSIGFRIAAIWLTCVPWAPTLCPRIASLAPPCSFLRVFWFFFPVPLPSLVNFLNRLLDLQRYNVSSLSSANKAVAMVQRYFILGDLPLGCDLLGRREALQFASSGSNSTPLCQPAW